MAQIPIAPDPVIYLLFVAVVVLFGIDAVRYFRDSASAQRLFEERYRQAVKDYAGLMRDDDDDDANS